jgi:hypothetical protein
MLLVGKPEGKLPLRRPRLKWVDNIKMDLGEISWGGMDWIAPQLAATRVVLSSIVSLLLGWLVKRCIIIVPVT